MTNDWTEWLDIDASSEHKSPAVYKVRLIDANGKCCQLPRLLRADEEGIMCIGQTSNMERRRKQFLTAMNKGYGHSSMNLVFYLDAYTDFQNKFKNAKFQYSFCRCSSVVKGKDYESALVKSYFKKFGEVPPLSSSIPNRYKGWEP